MTRTNLILALAAGATALLAFLTLYSNPNDTSGAAREIRIVGSSTVFPFSSSVAENYGQKYPSRPPPIVESTGTGGGFKLFCAGTGLQHPDIANASRRIKESEYQTCRANGIDLTEVRIGFDGIVLANAKKGPPFALTRRQIFQALAKEVPIDGQIKPNPYKKWREIDPSLPDLKIEVLGPPPTSGTRDAFVEIAMEGGAKTFPILKTLRERNKKAFKRIAHLIREDGAFIEAGENDNLIVQKLIANESALGIFGYSFLANNSGRLKGATVEGAAPTFENIASGQYAISRSLFFYLKKNHVGIVPGLNEFVQEFTSEDSWGKNGYLAEKGLIPIPEETRKAKAAEARALISLDL